MTELKCLLCQVKDKTTFDRQRIFTSLAMSDEHIYFCPPCQKLADRTLRLTAAMLLYPGRRVVDLSASRIRTVPKHSSKIPKQDLPPEHPDFVLKVGGVSFAKGDRVRNRIEGVSGYIVGFIEEGSDELETKRTLLHVETTEGNVTFWPVSEVEPLNKEYGRHRSVEEPH